MTSVYYVIRSTERIVLGAWNTTYPSCCAHVDRPLACLRNPLDKREHKTCLFITKTASS
uniref:Uncharacterized protein n=1 Tax=Arundo donax TaxID=35708 RepID=A0A0A8Y761_ARUDO